MSYNIILIGFMGCGKTSIGNILACELGYSFIDSDEKIEEISQKSINQIFQIYGETYFRQLESSVIKNISKIDNQVIATGGGIIKSQINIYELKKNGLIIYLKASPEHIYNNLKEDNSRPLLQVDNKIETIKVLLNEREVFYEKYADIMVDVSNKDIETISQIIFNTIKDVIF